MDVGNLISGSSAFPKSSLNIWKLSVHRLLKPGLENSEHHFASTWAPLVTQRVKRLSTTQETWVQSLGWEDPWRRKWQPTPVLLPGKSHGQRSLVGYSPRGCKALDTTERLHFLFFFLSFLPSLPFLPSFFLSFLPACEMSAVMQ